MHARKSIRTITFRQQPGPTIAWGTARKQRAPEKRAEPVMGKCKSCVIARKGEPKNQYIQATARPEHSMGGGNQKGTCVNKTAQNLACHTVESSAVARNGELQTQCSQSIPRVQAEASCWPRERVGALKSSNSFSGPTRATSHPIPSHLTSPHLISPHLTSPHRAPSRLTPLQNTPPHPTPSHLVSPHNIAHIRTSPDLIPSHLTSPHLTSSHPISPHRSSHPPM